MSRIRSYFDRNDGNVIIPVCLFPLDSLTEQHHKDDCDINHILDVFKRTGVNIGGSRVGFYDDVSTLPQDLLEAHELVRDSRERFMELPAVVRERFNNDPVQLLSFIQDPFNRDESVELGLLSAPENLHTADKAVESSQAGGTD